jgi:uncharacterized phage protein (TIGR02218 family)
MKPASADLVAYLQNTTRFLFADCFTLTLRTGTQVRVCDRDLPVVVSGSVFQANGIRVSGLKYAIKIGVDVDEQDITIAATANDLIGGVPFLVALRRGVLDGATIQRDRAFFNAWTAPAIGSVTLFHGRVSTVDKIGRTEASLKVKSDLVLLDTDMPRNLYQPSCLHTLYDAGCGVDRTAHTATGAVQAGSTVSKIVWSGATAGVYDQGTLVFTSGANAGVQVTIKTSDASGNLALSYPLDTAPGVGDGFTISAGCDHSTGAGGCLKFANLPNFRGFPFVPPPETAY